MHNRQPLAKWAHIPDEQWNDWHWQISHRITTVEELKEVISLTEGEKTGIAQCLKTLRMAVTPYYMSLINPADPHCPVQEETPSRSIIPMK